MASSDKSEKDWIDAYHDVQKITARTPEGKGWKSFAELRESLNLGNSKCRALIKDLQKQGKVEVYAGSSPDCLGQLKRRVWYKLK